MGRDEADVGRLVVAGQLPVGPGGNEPHNVGEPELLGQAH